MFIQLINLEIGYSCCLTLNVYFSFVRETRYAEDFLLNKKYTINKITSSDAKIIRHGITIFVPTTPAPISFGLHDELSPPHTPHKSRSSEPFAVPAQSKQSGE